MARWENPEELTTSELVEFLHNEHIYHTVGSAYSNGQKVVDSVYKEIASRLSSAKWESGGKIA